MTIKAALVYGGYSKEDEISLNSADCVAASIDIDIFTVYRISITPKGWFFIDGDFITPVDKNNFSIQTQTETIIPDVAYIMIHGTPGEDGLLQGYFDMLHIPYTTCNAFVSALTFNKMATKQYLIPYGILTAKAQLFRKNQPIISTNALISELGLPLFIKPNNGGSSFGVSKVKTENYIMQAVEKAFTEDYEVIAEQFIAGQELTCGVFKTSNKTILFPVTEIISQNEFFDYEAKYKGLSQEITPAQISQELTEQIQNTSLKIYNLLGCSGIVRIDYLYNGEQLYFMEINTVPGMSEASIIPQQARCYGISMKELNTLILNNALRKNVFITFAT